MTASRGRIEAVVRTEGVEGMGEISGVARAVVAHHEMAGHVGVDAGKSVGQACGLAEHVAHHSGAEGLALVANGAHAGGKGVGHGVAVLLADAGEKRLSGLTVGGLARKEGTHLALGGEASVLHDEAGAVAQRVGQTGKVVEIQRNGHGIAPLFEEECHENPRQARRARPLSRRGRRGLRHFFCKNHAVFSKRSAPPLSEKKTGEPPIPRFSFSNSY